MKHLIFAFSLITIFANLTSCKPFQNNNSLSSLDYDLLSNKHILFENIFDIDKEHYFVYIYSKNCLHCILIKNQVLHIGLKKDNIYFIEYYEDIPIQNNIIDTIGATDIDDLFIIGTPTLIEIVGGKVVVNTYSSDLILTLLSE